MKEAAEVSNFLQEVEKCKQFRATDAAVQSGEASSDTCHRTISPTALTDSLLSLFLTLSLIKLSKSLTWVQFSFSPLFFPR